MTIVRCGAAEFDVEAVVFDKDGTLTSLEAYWLEPARAWIEVAAAGSARLATTLHRELGLTSDGLDPDGALATGSFEYLIQRTQQMLEDDGVASDDAAARASEAGRRAAAMSSALPLQPIGDVERALRALVAAGLRLAIATTDDDIPTRTALQLLGIEHLVDMVVTADGEVPPKPHPAVLGTIADRFGIAPSSILMVGDSRRDADTARAGGAAGFVLVAANGDGRGIPADAVIGSVEEIRAPIHGRL
jgi:phosphoglycolate phosphatase